MNLIGEVFDSLGRCPDKVIARDEQRELTGSGLVRMARTAGRALAAATDRPRIGLLMPGCALYPPLLFGTMACGKIPVPLNPQLKPDELRFILQEANIDTVVALDATRLAGAAAGAKVLDADDLAEPDLPPLESLAPAALESVAVLLYTSGTTGRPKGVPLTHNNLLSNVRAIIARIGAWPDDVFLALLPPFHTFGLTASMLVPLMLGADVTFTRLTPAAVLAAMARRAVTNLVAVPSIYRMLARAHVSQRALRALRIAVSGGDALPAMVRDEFRRKFGLDLLEGYGLTETSPVVCVNTLEENKPGTVGKPLPGMNVRICAPGDTELTLDHDGEVQVRGPGVMSGYFERPRETAAAFTPDGWFRTGDLGHLDSDGYLTIVGRIKDLIVRDGEKIMPREVEAVLEQHPQVVDAAVIGEPEPGRGEAVVAFIIPSDPAPTEQELRSLCREHLAEFKVPRRFVVATDLPKGPTGKILKRLLRERKPG